MTSSFIFLSHYNGGQPTVSGKLELHRSYSVWVTHHVNHGKESAS